MKSLLKLKVSPKGQITLPKSVRSDLSIKDFVYLEIKNNRVILKPVSFADEFEDLIVRDLIHDGYSSEEIVKLIPVKKKIISKAILDEIDDRSKEETISREKLMNELKEE